jgi:small ligand-binding sensory domain FIST
VKWAAATSDEHRCVEALAEITRDLRGGLGDRPPDLGLIFATPHHDAAWPEISDALADAFPDTVWLGCSGGGTLGGGRELEGGGAIAAIAASLPGVKLHPFHLPQDDVPDSESASEFWTGHLGLEPGTTPHFLLLPDPFSCDVKRLISGLDHAFPAGTKVGGLASGAQAPGENTLFVGGQLHRNGAVGVALTGNVEVETIVAQGCRPIGHPMFITGCNGPFITELDGRKPLEVLQELHETLSPDDQELFRFSLFLGLVMRAHQVEYGHGDFLIRNLAGIEPESGAVAVGAEVEANQVVQFHLRDAATSTDDLRAHLEACDLRTPPNGALLFSCLGRGENLYGEPGHDSAAFLSRFGEVPLAGFFCNGEIGPIQGETYLHGYTSVFAMFRPKSS